MTEKEYNIHIFNQGQSLDAIVNQQGWRVVEQFLDDICKDAETRLVKTDPADTSRIIAAHAFAHASRDTQHKLLSQIEETIAASQNLGNEIN